MVRPQYQTGRSNIAKAIVTLGNYLILRQDSHREQICPMTKQPDGLPEDLVGDVITALAHALARSMELIPDANARIAACSRATRDVVETVQQTILTEKVPTTTN
jgi:hypothetical protein